MSAVAGNCEHVTEETEIGSQLTPEKMECQNCPNAIECEEGRSSNVVVVAVM